MRTRKECLDALRRRHAWLTERIEAADTGGKDLSYDKAERGALEWVFSLVDPKGESKTPTKDDVRRPWPPVRKTT